MARPRNPKRDEAKRMWLTSDGNKPLVDIAKELECSPSQIRKWKSLDNWDDKMKGSVPIEKERYQTLKGNKSAKGNKGNDQASPPLRNQNARTHGLFAKYLPDETKEIMDELSISEPADIIWNNIMIQYTAIIRAQQIMYVSDSEDLSKEKSGYSSGAEGHGESYAVQYAWDKQATFLNSQSRAMGTLSNLIKQFISISDEADERRLKLESMRMAVDKTQAEIRRLRIQNGDSEPEEIADDGFMEAIKGIATDSEVWDDDNIET